jgi:hypothetical protein
MIFSVMIGRLLVISASLLNKPGPAWRSIYYFQKSFSMDSVQTTISPTTKCFQF